MVVYEEEHSKRLTLWEIGMTDEAIAEICHVERNTITSWRHRNNIPSHFRKNNKLTPEKNLERLVLYQIGLNDRQIAETIKSTRAAICQWRAKYNLPKNV